MIEHVLKGELEASDNLSLIYQTAQNILCNSKIINFSFITLRKKIQVELKIEIKPSKYFSFIYINPYMRKISHNVYLKMLSMTIFLSLIVS